MKKKEEKVKTTKRQYDKGQIFVKIMAGILALLMVAGTGITRTYGVIKKTTIWHFSIVLNNMKTSEVRKGETSGNKFRNELGKFL